MGKLRDYWENIETSFWFLPAILVAFSVLLALVFLNLDRQLLITPDSPIGFFSGSAEAARGLLSTIATSLITAISIIFSVTIIALQQAATQYSPRVLRNFTSDKGNQAVLGVFLGTFLYSLLILRSIRAQSDLGASFLPSLSITFGLMLTILCVGLLIYFISHIATSIQVERIIRSIHTILNKEIDNLYPDNAKIISDAEISITQLFNQLQSSMPVIEITSGQSGFVHSIDYDSLKELRSDKINAVLVIPEVGDYIAEGQPIIRIGENSGAKGDYDPNAFERSVILNDRRSIEQDPLFAINQLVDVALRALSPSLNDPTTAKYCLFHLTDVLAKLSAREFPPEKRIYKDNPITYIYNMPTWPKFIDAAFGQIRRMASSNVHVTGTLIEQLHKLALLIPEGNRWKPIELQIIEIKKSIEKQGFNDIDRLSLMRKISYAEQEINERKLGRDQRAVNF